jgi:hypothetical protein
LKAPREQRAWRGLLGLQDLRVIRAALLEPQVNMELRVKLDPLVPRDCKVILEGPLEPQVKLDPLDMMELREQLVPLVLKVLQVLRGLQVKWVLLALMG